jgi:SAM-dependent methyltransferase
MSLNEFVLSQLPPPQARVLEIGCGAGELARALDAEGYAVLAIDPDAPEGGIFRSIRLEDLDDPGPFDAAVASFSLHHISALGAALERIASIAPLVVIDEFAWDRADEATLRWYGEQKGEAITLASWKEERADLHGYRAMRRELDARFQQRHFEWRPYFYRDLPGRPESLERALIQSGTIRATAFRYVGTRR